MPTGTKWAGFPNCFSMGARHTVRPAEGDCGIESREEKAVWASSAAGTVHFSKPQNHHFRTLLVFCEIPEEKEKWQYCFDQCCVTLVCDISAQVQYIFMVHCILHKRLIRYIVQCNLNSVLSFWSCLQLIYIISDSGAEPTGTSQINNAQWAQFILSDLPDWTSKTERKEVK